MDLRARIRTASAYDDCLRVRRSVSPSEGGDGGENNDDDHDDESEKDPCAAALEELARGIATLADGPLSIPGACDGVFVRIVRASDYRAREPPYHTDKCPLRGYVTLCGPGTEYVPRPSSPLEYLALRTLGSGAGEIAGSVRPAGELEFIVMKGDYYEAPAETSWLKDVWQRASACVHRSPPGTGGRRVIVSFDLADGDDDREWYQAGTKREWRSGMTQRKSRLVS